MVIVHAGRAGMMSEERRQLVKRFRRDARYSLARFVKFEYIVGGSLKRLRYLGRDGDLWVFATRLPSYNDRSGQCDMCARRHRPTNISCSRTLGVSTYAAVDGVVYSAVTRQRDPRRWDLVESSSGYPGSRVVLEKYAISGTTLSGI